MKVLKPRLVKLFLYRAHRRARTQIQRKTRTCKYQTRIQPQAQTCLIPRSKLLKLTLPKFKGQVTKWGSFWDSYSSSIHDNSEISKINKFNYLNSLLEGAALRAIQGLTLTGANYDSAIQILKDRFFNHYSASCTKVQNLEQRKGILRRDRQCFVCLQQGH